MGVVFEVGGQSFVIQAFLLLLLYKRFSPQKRMDSF